MAITNEKSTQLAGLDLVPTTKLDTTEFAGKVRIMYFDHTQSEAGAIGSSVEICKLPRGSVRILGAMSSLKHNWTTASQIMNIGWDAYTDANGATIAADLEGIDIDVDVDTAGTTTVGSALDNGTMVFSSKEGVTIRLSAEVALAANDAVSGYIMYVVR